MKHFATLIVGTSTAVFLAVCDVGGRTAERGVSADDLDAGVIADLGGLPDGHPSISGLMGLPEGHPPVLPEGHPPVPDFDNQCPRSVTRPLLPPGDAFRVPREPAAMVAI
jgi:hypothetical protein